jgi:hypothetical protein
MHLPLADRTIVPYASCSDEAGVAGAKINEMVRWSDLELFTHSARLPIIEFIWESRDA